METGMDLNVSDGGKKLGLKELSLEIAELFVGESPIAIGEMETMTEDEYKREMAKIVEKRIVDYFTTSTSATPQ